MELACRAFVAAGIVVRKMIRTAEIEVFHDEAEHGRTRPLRVSVRTGDGESHDAYLKLSARIEVGVEGLSNEVIAACLAGDLGLPIPEPFLVRLTPEWIAAVPNIAVRNALGASAGVAFASKAAGRQWQLWRPGDQMTTARQQAALEILSFDAFIGNDDRKFAHNKPNCLVRGDQFRIIDHEAAFCLKLKLFPKLEPWRPLHLAGWTDPDNHIFGAKLLGRPALDFDRVRSPWKTLTDSRLGQYRRALPGEWSASKDAVDLAMAHLATVRDRIDVCVGEVKRVLNG